MLNGGRGEIRTLGASYCTRFISNELVLTTHPPFRVLIVIYYMAVPKGIEPSSLTWQASVLTIERRDYIMPLTVRASGTSYFYFTKAKSFSSKTPLVARSRIELPSLSYEDNVLTITPPRIWLEFIQKETKLVGREGLEPSRTKSHLIYSQGRYQLRATFPQ